jgi:RHS repeat-associated protein
MSRVEGGSLRVFARAVGVVLMVGAALLVYAGLAGAAGEQGPSDAGSQGETASTAAKGRELVGQRSARSRTYEGAGGVRIAEVFTEPVNYRDPEGAWKPIDNTLVERPDGGFANRANSWTAALPAQLDQPVRVEEDGDWLEFSLLGAKPAAAAVEGSMARYANALPGVDVVYQAGSDSLKEELVLAGAGGPAAFSFALSAAEGLTARETRDGGVELLRDGRAAFELTPPFAVDADGDVGAVDYDLTHAGGGFELDVEVDREWLAAPGRSFPVVVDPTVNFTGTDHDDQAGAEADCTLDAGAPTTSRCALADLEVGVAGGNARRAVLRFDVDEAVAHQVEVLDAELELEMFQNTRAGATPADVDLHRVSADWASPAATWQNRTSTNAWTAAGGDFATPRATYSASVGSGGPGSYSWHPTALVQSWIDEDHANQGVLLKTAEDSAGLLRFNSSEAVADQPKLTVVYEFRTGDRRQWTFVRQQLWDRASLAVNVANGNLMVSQQDLQVAGTGLDLSVSRTWNSFGEHRYDLGEGWQFDHGNKVGLERWGNSTHGDSYAFFGPTGYAALFQRLPGGGFRSPDALDATLVEHVDGTFTMTFDKTKEQLRFDDRGWLTQQRDRNGNAISYAFTSSGKLDQITDTQGRVVDFGRNGSGEIVDMLDSSGRDFDYEMVSGLLESYTDPAGESTDYDYDGNDRLTEITDPRGNRILFGYDSWRRVTEIVRVTDPINDTGPTWTFDYDLDNGLTEVYDPRGKKTTYHWDAKARVTRVTDANGNHRDTTYTPSSEVATATAPGSATTTMGYDSLNNLTSVDEPAGEASTFEYNNGSHPRFPTKQTSPQGTGSVFAYDGAGNTTTIGDSSSPASQVEAKLEYNGQAGGSCPDDPTTKPGTLRCAIDGKGNETLYGYDDAGNLTSVTPELPLGDTTITYDSLSRVDTVEDGKGQTRSYTYDLLDRVTEIDYGSGETVTYDYDDNGNQIERIDSVHGTSTWAYDELNRRVEDDLPSGDTDYAWDAAGNLTSLTDAGGTVTYRYDNVNRLADLAEPGGSCTSPVSLCTTFGYTNRDQRERTTYPNGVEQTVTFDSSDKPTRIRAVKGATVLTDFTYDYERASPTLQTDLRHSVTDKDGNEITYGYDFLDRLTSAVERNSGNAIIDDRAYTYDLASNRQTQTINGATTSYAYNAANQLCWTYSGASGASCGSPPGGATTYTYDANGNTAASSAGLDFDYNVRDQTTAFTAPGGSPISFGYASTGQTERTSRAGSVQHNTLLGLSREGTTSWTRDPDGTLISQRASGGVHHYYLSEGLGSVVGLTDSTGALTRSYKYDPYGALRSTTGATPNPFMFTGQYGESGGGLYKMGARYYGPGLGRWSQLDPLDQAGDLREGNRYAYAGADPVNLTDPTGCGVGELLRCVSGEVAFKCYKKVRACSNLLRSPIGGVQLFLGCLAVTCGPAAIRAVKECL